MPADLTRDEIERLRSASRIDRAHVYIRAGAVTRDRYDALLDMAAAHLDEPTRLASARQEGRQDGYRAGVEAAAQLCDREGTHWHSAGDADLTEYGKGSKTAARGLAKSIRALALSPAPAEPSAPVASRHPSCVSDPDAPDGLSRYIETETE